MTFKQLVTYSFDKWWRPILLLLTTGLLLGLSVWSDTSVLQIPAFVLFCLSIAILGFSLIFQLWKKRWINAILTFLILGCTIAVCLFFAIVFFIVATNELDEPDKFADNLKIPKNITIYTPADINFDKKKPDSISNIQKKDIDFQLYNSIQPGVYEYEFWTSKINRGIIYLKAYEITQNYPLSTSELPSSSSVKIFNDKDSIIKIGTSHFFTIYEGDWGKPYAARFEVWYKPSTGEQETKLFEKNYKIEGWMR